MGTQNGLLTWKDPATGGVADTITAIETAIKIKGADDSAYLTTVDTVAPGVQAVTFPDLPDGTYVARIVAINGTVRGDPVTIEGTSGTPPATSSTPATPVKPGLATNVAFVFS